MVFVPLSNMVRQKPYYTVLYRAMKTSVPPPQPTAGPGERRELLHRGLRQSPGRKRISVLTSVTKCLPLRCFKDRERVYRFMFVKFMGRRFGSL